MTTDTDLEELLSENLTLALYTVAYLTGYTAAYLWRRRLGNLRFRLAMRLIP